MLQRMILKMKSEQGVGVIVPSDGAACAKDGSVMVEWDDGRRVKYYRSEDGGTRYPLLPADRRTEEKLRSRGSTETKWTLLLGLNATAVAGRAEREEEERRRSRLLKRALKLWERSFLANAFRKLKEYRRTRSFCLLTMTEIHDDDDSSQRFYHPFIQKIMGAKPHSKRQQVSVMLLLLLFSFSFSFSLSPRFSSSPPSLLFLFVLLYFVLLSLSPLLIFLPLSSSSSTLSPSFP